MNAPPNMLPLVDAVQPRLATERFGRSMRGFRTVDSTNTRAARWAKNGAAEGSVVVAEFQEQGRGRHGRTWHAERGTNLMFSVVLRPAVDANRLGLITIAAGVAVAEAVEGAAAPLRATIKWPNDILLRDRKCCGMLLESTFSGQRAGRPDAVILGVGLNVNQEAFPQEVAGRAISIRQAAHRPIERPPLFADLLRHLEHRYDALPDDSPAVRTAYASRLRDLDRSVCLRFTGSAKEIRGTVQGIAPDGALRLRTAAGLQTVHAGEVTSR